MSKGIHSGFHAEREAINQACDYFGVNFTHYRENPKGLAKALYDKGAIIVHVYTEFQPCEDCHDWLKKLEEGVAHISVRFSKDLETRGMTKGQKKDAFKDYMKSFAS